MKLPSRTPRRDDQQLIRYLLGLLPEDQAEDLDEASIADDAVAERLRIVEDELVDGYVHHTLDCPTRERFESFYLSSPRRRDRVKFAASLARAAEASAAVVAQPAARPGATWASWRLPAAAVLLLAVSGAMFVGTLRMRSRLGAEGDARAALEQRTRELTQQLDQQRAAANAALEELARARVSAGAATAPRVETETPTSVATVLGLVLLPQTRSLTAIPSLSVPRGTERVTFTLRLESNDFPRYQVSLQDPATKQVMWRSSWIAPDGSAKTPSVPVVVPAPLLKSQHYSLDLAGRSPDGHTEIVGSYTVRIM